MHTVDKEKEELLTRISKTVEALMQRDSLYREYSLDKDEIIRTMFKMFSENFSMEELKARPDIYFTEIVEAHMMTELLLAGEKDSSEDLSERRNAIKARITAIVDRLLKNDSFFQNKLNQPETSKLLVNLFTQDLIEVIKDISDEELTRRIDFILAIEAVAGTLNDLTPEQIEMFDAAVEGR